MPRQMSTRGCPPLAAWLAILAGGLFAPAAAPATAPVNFSKSATASSPAAAIVATEQLLLLVREAPIATGYTACAVFDADGTLWDFDLSSTLVKQTLQQRAASALGLPAMNALLATFGLPPGADIYQATRTIDDAFDSGALHAAGRSRGWDEDAVNVRLWPHYNWLYLGLAPTALTSRAQQLMAEAGYRTRVFAGMRQLVTALRGRGMRVRAISGGVHEFVEVAAAELGFTADEVRGLKVKVVNDLLTADVVEPVPYQQGKAVIARELCGGAPLFAFGDSVASGDAAMLAIARYAVAVRPKERHLTAAQSAGMMIFEHPELVSAH